MEPAEAKLTRLGEVVREALTRAGDPALDIRGARDRVLNGVALLNARQASRGVSGRGRRVFFLFPAILVPAALAALLWVKSPLSFSVGTAEVPGRLGDVVEASGSEPVGLQFSEGSSIVVAKGGRVRVLTAESAGARVLLEDGNVDVAIVHRRRGQTRWRFDAGPMTVLVTGTTFNAGWNPEQQSFSLDMKEGSVVVSGACLPQPRVVRGGENLRLSCLPPAAAPVTTAALHVAAPKAPTPRPAPAIALVERPAAPSAAPTSQTSNDEDWRVLVANGQYALALRAAERIGFDRACRTANDSELLALADAARFSGRTARALEALQVLRRRFPSSLSAATAAFSLGRIAFEQRGAYTEAARWFAIYLEEQPNGPLMGDAVGRLMEARNRAGDKASAHRDAERYLQRFPSGPYAGTASNILAE